MTKEREAIKIVEGIVKSYIEADECGLSNNDFKHEIRALQTVLNMLKEKDKEIERLEKQSKNLDKQAQQYFEQTIYLDKQIDLMAEFMFLNIDIEEDICNSAYVECKQETSQDITCINCIKQYFERKSEE